MYMQFRVPQFIDIEDKIFGPFTFKQFAYLLGAGGFAFVFWTIISIKIIAILFIIPVSGLFLALAFVKINSRPFADVLESAFKYYLGEKIYIWQQPKVKTKLDDPIITTIQTASKDLLIPKSKASRLREISFGLDVLDKNNVDQNNP